MSTQTSVNCGTLLRSSGVSRWMARRATTPAIGPVLRPHGQVLAEQDLHVPAADRLDVEEAVSSMCCTMRPIWSQWPASMIRGGVGRPAFREADGDDVAVRVGADLVGERLAPSSRTTSWIGRSNPDGLGVSSSVSEELVRRVLHGLLAMHSSRDERTLASYRSGGNVAAREPPAIIQVLHGSRFDE